MPKKFKSIFWATAMQTQMKRLVLWIDWRSRIKQSWHSSNSRSVCALTILFNFVCALHHKAKPSQVLELHWFGPLCRQGRRNSGKAIGAVKEMRALETYKNQKSRYQCAFFQYNIYLTNLNFCTRRFLWKHDNTSKRNEHVCCKTNTQTKLMKQNMAWNVSVVIKWSLKF